MTAAVIVERAEMGISHADFRRIFPRLVSDAESDFDGSRVSVRWRDGSRLVVSLAPEGERRIALLRLPTTDLRFEFHAFDPGRCAAFMQRFDRAFQKGGG